MNVRLSRVDLDDLDLGRRDLDLGTVQGRLTFSLFDESGPSTNDAQRLWIDAELEAELIVVERDGDLARQALILQFRRQRLARPPSVEPKSEHRGDPAMVRLADGLAQGELTPGQDFAKLGRGLRIDVVDERSPSIALGPERSPPR